MRKGIKKLGVKRAKNGYILKDLDNEEEVIFQTRDKETDEFENAVEFLDEIISMLGFSYNGFAEKNIVIRIERGDELDSGDN